jgi:Nucleotidyl transferase AbiEii toxin, Type IV TA system
MKYATAAAFRAALDQRLKMEAERTGISLARLRKRVVFELFLRRLVQVAPSRWVLKGAFALDLRLEVATRPTKDIDLGPRRQYRRGHRRHHRGAAARRPGLLFVLGHADHSFRRHRRIQRDPVPCPRRARWPDLRTVCCRRRFHGSNQLDARHNHHIEPARFRRYFPGRPTRGAARPAFG